MSRSDMGVWVGLKRCGCCVAVCVDDPDYPGDVERTKHEFLSSGLSVVYSTRDDWQTKHLLSMQTDCEHKTPTATQGDSLSEEPR